MLQADWGRGPSGCCCRGVSWLNTRERTGEMGSSVHYLSDKGNRLSLRTAYTSRPGDGEYKQGEGTDAIARDDHGSDSIRRTVGETGG